MLLVGRKPSGRDQLVKTSFRYPILYATWENIIPVCIRRLSYLNLVGGLCFLFGTGVYSFKIIGDLILGKYYC